MIVRRTILGIILLSAPTITDAQGPAWVVQSLPTDSDDATPLLLQTDSDAAPEWGILNGSDITIAEIATQASTRKLTLPAGTALFDLRDTDRDGKLELATVRAGRLEYWADATTATRADPSFFIEDATIAAISIGGPRPYPLFLKDRGEDYVTVPIGDTPPILTLDGTPLPAPMSSPAGLLTRTQYHAWSSPADATANQPAEIRINQLYERESPRTSAAPATASPRSGGNRRARDASTAPYEDWPWYSLSGASRISYALAPPDFRDTLVRVDRRDTPRQASASEPNPRRFPGILIAPSESVSDFNGDGFNDLLLWNAPRPGASLDPIIRAAQSGDWEVELTVHLFDPASGRFEARPLDWIRTKASLEGVLAGSVRGPFDYIRLSDLDGNGRTDLLCSGAGNELVAWTFTGRRAAEPWARLQLRERIEEVVLIANVPGYHWLGIVRGARAFHLAALPKR